MKKILLFFYTSFILETVTHAQIKMGDMACVYFNTANPDSSISVYEKLGFTKTDAGEYPAPWAQVSDGSLVIMLRKDTASFAALAYYTNNLESIITQLEKDSIIFYKKPGLNDLLKRYYIKSPDGFIITIANNPGGFTKPTGITLLNMPPADFMKADKYPNKQCGAFGEYAQPVNNLAVSIAFWKKLGFAVKAVMQAPYPHAILSDGLMLIGLHQTAHFNYAAVTYFGINTDTRIQALKEKGLTDFKEMPNNKNVHLTTWEKQHFFIFSLGM
jgi:hypothetical protein